jgi:hypothetical protein
LVAELLEVEKGALEALRRGDKEAIAKLLDDSYTGVQDGTTYTKDQYLQMMTPTPGLRVEYQNCIAASSGDEATLACECLITVEQGGATRSVKTRFRDKFLKTATGWITKSSETTTIQ